jgi:hypothetical protein
VAAQAVWEVACFEPTWWFILGRSSAWQYGGLHGAGAGRSASLAPSAVVDRHLRQRVVIDGIDAGVWAVLHGRGRLWWMPAWLRRAFLSLQLMFGRGGGCCLSAGGCVGFWSMSAMVWWCGLVVAVLSSSSSPMCVLSWVGL